MISYIVLLSVNLKIILSQMNEFMSKFQKFSSRVSSHWAGNVVTRKNSGRRMKNGKGCIEGTK